MVIPASLHKTLRASAAVQSRTMNDLVVDALVKYIKTDSAELDSFVNGWLRQSVAWAYGRCRLWKALNPLRLRRRRRRFCNNV